MTKLGVKWSDIAPSALPLVDLIEVDGWMLGDPLPLTPMLLHNLEVDFSITAPGIFDEGWYQRCARALAATGSPWLSLHLGFSAEKVRFQDHMLPASEVLDRQTCFDRCVEGLRSVCERLDVPLLVENLDYCPEGAYEHVCEPEFIAEVLAETGCGLLLDLAHLQVSADWLGMEPKDYLGYLPLDRVVEVHLSSPRQVGKRLDDCHFHMIERDYALLSYLLERCSPEAVVLEYRRDEELMLEQLRTLRSLLEGL